MSTTLPMVPCKRIRTVPRLTRSKTGVPWEWIRMLTCNLSVLQMLPEIQAASLCRPPCILTSAVSPYRCLGQALREVPLWLDHILRGRCCTALRSKGVLVERLSSRRQQPMLARHPQCGFKWTTAETVVVRGVVFTPGLLCLQERKQHGTCLGAGRTKVRATCQLRLILQLGDT